MPTETDPGFNPFSYEEFKYAWGDGPFALLRFLLDWLAFWPTFFYHLWQYYKKGFLIVRIYIFQAISNIW